MTMVAMPLAVVGVSPGTQPSSMQSDMRMRDRTGASHPLGPQPRNTGPRTSSGLAASANQWVGLHRTRPNTEPDWRRPVAASSGAPTATSTDAVDDNQRRSPNHWVALAARPELEIGRAHV